MLTLEHNGRIYSNWTVEDALAQGVPQGVVGAALKTSATEEVSSLADRYRAMLSSASAGKLAEYRIKEEIARDPTAASAEELALLDREAAAKGIDRVALLAIISTKAAAYRQIALLIGALEAETDAAISAVPDAALDVEDQIKAVLAAAKLQAETALSEALTLINGGA